MAIGSFIAGLVAPVFSHTWGWQGIFAVGGIFSARHCRRTFLSRSPSRCDFLVARAGDAQQIARQIQQIAPHLATRFDSDKPLVPTAKASIRDLFAAPYRMRTVLVWIIFLVQPFRRVFAHQLAADFAGVRWPDSRCVTTGERLAGVGWLGWGPSHCVDRRSRLRDHRFGGRVLRGGAGCFRHSPGSLRNVAVWSVLLFSRGRRRDRWDRWLPALSPPLIITRRKCVSTGVGWFNGVGRIGAVVGPLVVAALMRRGWASGHIFSTLALPLLICAGGVFIATPIVANGLLHRVTRSRFEGAHLTRANVKRPKKATKLGRDSIVEAAFCRARRTRSRRFEPARAGSAIRCFKPRALYWHVHNKAELIGLMAATFGTTAMKRPCLKDTAVAVAAGLLWPCASASHAQASRCGRFCVQWRDPCRIPPPPPKSVRSTADRSRS